jgi:hypothetical protein
VSYAHSHALAAGHGRDAHADNANVRRDVLAAGVSLILPVYSSTECGVYWNGLHA